MKKGLLPLALLAGMALPIVGSSQKNFSDSDNNARKPKIGRVYEADESEHKILFGKTKTDVGVGEIEYSTRPMKSRGFYSCTAVILDHGKGAVLSHALPGYDIVGKSRYNSSNDSMITGNNVVRKSINELESRGINPKDAEATIVAGSKKELEIIVEDLKKAEIPIKEGRLYILKGGVPEAIDVHFDPRSDKLVVRESRVTLKSW